MWPWHQNLLHPHEFLHLPQNSSWGNYVPQQTHHTHDGHWNIPPVFFLPPHPHLPHPWYNTPYSFPMTHHLPPQHPLPYEAPPEWSFHSPSIHQSHLHASSSNDLGNNGTFGLYAATRRVPPSSIHSPEAIPPSPERDQARKGLKLPLGLVQ
jgi:hypothetical protein